MVKPQPTRRTKGRPRHNFNLGLLLTAAGCVLLASSIFILFEWGAPYAAICAVAGVVLFIIGQGRPRQSGGHRWR